MARMVEDLLDVSRIATGKMAIRLETVDLTGLVSTISSSLGPVFEGKGRSLSMSLPEEPVLVEADPTRFAQVVSNLLQNALKFTRSGGHVWLSLREEGGRAVLKVRDDGVGIPPELLDRVFDLFAQGERAAVRPESGLGIGLTLVRRLTELQGGSVDVTSDGPDAGAEFTVTLPSSRTARLSERPAAPPRTAPAIPRRVLIVEDDADLMQGLALLLQIDGHDVATAGDGASALARCAEFRPEAVLLDLGLPGMDGFEAVRRLRAELGPDTLIVALTGYNLDEDRIRTAKAGFDHHLVKPVELEQIRRLLATLDGPPPVSRAGT
jgi:CheY-like chemotaxis protein